MEHHVFDKRMPPGYRMHPGTTARCVICHVNVPKEEVMRQEALIATNDVNGFCKG